MTITRTAILFAASTLFFACDQVNEPIPPGGGGGGGGGTVVTRRVLLEEFTGHRCSTCPAAHVVAQQLSTFYGDQLIIVGIHATSTFAAPVSPPNADGSYSTDFRTPAGDAYTTAFGVSFLPTGVVSRKPYNNSITLSQGNWGSAIGALVGQEADVDLWVESIDHNAGANTVGAVIKAAVLKPIGTELKLTLYLLEDHVIDWQINQQATPPDIPDYDHRYVLRTNLNGTWGEAMVPTGAQPGDTLTLSYAGVAMDPAWNPANCSLVAYLYRADGYEVMQAAQRKFQP
ncbi:MAG: Omp28-related outer membrane protein [Flavobacteriales bacterium]|nr:Omp28-related outer membrane protein [Flavobacteriales bacterium]